MNNRAEPALVHAYVTLEGTCRACPASWPYLYHLIHFGRGIPQSGHPIRPQGQGKR
jgi:hypothetical protein